jgi:hypothetical protein
VNRDELILRTRQLLAEGERLAAAPSMTALQTWLQLSDDLLATAWGTMDRYHLAWLMVGKPKGVVRGRGMTPDEEAAYVREVASQKTAALRMSLDAAERQRMPFRGETGGVGAGQGMGDVPRTGADVPPALAAPPPALPASPPALAASSRRAIPLDPRLQQRLDEVRRAAAEHAEHLDHAERAEPAGHASRGTIPIDADADADADAESPAEADVAPVSPAQRRAPRPERLLR